MEDPIDKICRLCLNVTSNNNIQVLNEIHKIQISYILPELNISVSNSPILCKTCIERLQESYDFRTACVEIESCLDSFITPGKQLILDEVVYNKMFLGGSRQCLKNNGMCRICRLCLNTIEGTSFQEFNTIEENILQKCVPEMDLTLTEAPVSCENCLEYLHNQFNFVMKCLDIDETINDYLKSKGVSSCSLHEVLKFSSERCSLENKDYLEDYMVDDKSIIDTKDILGSCENSFEKIKVESIIEDHTRVLGTEEVHIKSESSSNDPAPSGTYYRCDICSYIANRKYSLRIHSLVHKTREECTMYKCPQCSHETRRKSNLLIHIIVKHKNAGDVTMHQCKNCPYQTKLRSNLLQHQLLHKSPEEVTMYRCQHCPYETRFKSNLLIHMIHHKKPEELVMHKCSECSYMTKFKNNLRKHFLIHKKPHEVNMYKCAQCEYRSKWKAHLLRHTFIHSSNGGNVYKCDQCSYVSNHKYHLKKHSITHKNPDEITMHKCNLCDFHTKRKDSLKLHMANMHNCSTCDYQTNDKEKLSKHIKSHEIPEEIYTCDLCTYEAKQKRYLQRHRKIHLQNTKQKKQ